MEPASEYVTRAEFEHFAEESRVHSARLDRTLAGVLGELRILKWIMGLGVAATVGMFGLVYQGLTDLRTEMRQADAALRSEIGGLRDEIGDLRERTTRLEEGQRFVLRRLEEVFQLLGGLPALSPPRDTPAATDAS